MITIMTESESIFTPLTSLLTRFPVLPRVLFYGNSSSLARYTRLQLPSVVEITGILSDRFRSKSHRCCSLFDLNSFPQFDGLLNSGAESLNTRISASRSHIIYFAGDNLVPFLYARSIFCNLRARIHEDLNSNDVEDTDLCGIFDNNVPCQ